MDPRYNKGEGTHFNVIGDTLYWHTPLWVDKLKKNEDDNLVAMYDRLGYEAVVRRFKSPLYAPVNDWMHFPRYPLHDWHAAEPYRRRWPKRKTSWQQVISVADEYNDEKNWFRHGFFSKFKMRLFFKTYRDFIGRAETYFLEDFVDFSFLHKLYANSDRVNDPFTLLDVDGVPEEHAYQRGYLFSTFSNNEHDDSLLTTFTHNLQQVRRRFKFKGWKRHLIPMDGSWFQKKKEIY